VKLRALAAYVGAALPRTADTREVVRLTCDSKTVRPGDLFVALRGTRVDGHHYVDEAMRRGAVAAVVERGRLAALRTNGCRSALLLPVDDTQAALVTLARLMHGDPMARIKLAGITGTNGKTTVSYLTAHLLRAAGWPTGMIGTIAYQLGERTIPATNTTPGVADLHAYLAQMAAHHLDWCVMEVSSHALDQERIAGLRFDAGVFTNLASDHLDYHQTREAYFQAKRKLFTRLTAGATAIINLDDAYGERLVEELRARADAPRLVTYGTSPAADIRAEEIHTTLAGSRCVVHTPVDRGEVTVPLIGRHNVSNLLAAVAVAVAHAIERSVWQPALEAFPGVPGRLELVARHHGARVFVDYAHTEEALRSVLLALRSLTSGRLLVLFGCGGDRDRTKRPKMGEVASVVADRVILTSDNPRSEEPAAILREIAAGFPPSFSACDVIEDRCVAIPHAIQQLRAGDILVIAGKGHETYQVLRDTTVPCDDRAIVRQAVGAEAPVLAKV